jgi:hypothetical protein
LTETPSVSPSSTRTTATLVVVVAFIGGLFVGIAGDHLYLFHHHRLVPSRQKEFSSRKIVDHMDRELHFTAEQKSQVQRIIEAHHARIEAVMTGVRPQVRSEFDAANAEIEKILTPQQREQFKKIRMRFANRRGMPPPPR